MADEIVRLRASAAPDGAVAHRAAFFYDLAASDERITDASGAVVAPQAPAASKLPGDAVQFLPSSALTAIDAGDALADVVVVTQTPGEAGADFIARVRAYFATRRSHTVGRLAAEYADSGQQVAP